MRACVWCGEAHGGLLQLCARCEETAKDFRARSGLALRPVAGVREEPDD